MKYIIYSWLIEARKEQLFLETAIFLIIIGVVVISILFNMLHQRKILKTLTEEQFREGYRKAQLIDVREPNEFENGHILGARNIPMSQMKMRLQEIRPDKPVYLYCQSGNRSAVPHNCYTKKAIKIYLIYKVDSKNGLGKLRQSNFMC